MPNVIHETILKDIADLLGDAKDLAANGSKALGNEKKVFNSLTQNANKLILVFPRCYYFLYYDKYIQMQRCF